ncbi:MAG: hypothetical protein ABIT20_07270 [Gemmatimonadaceae bacterium]
MTLRLVHIISGALWVGAVVFLAMYLIPTIRALGPNGGRILQQLKMRRFPLYMGSLPGLVLLSGIAMYVHASMITRGAFNRSHTGMALGIGGVLALLATIIGGAVAGRSADALTALDTDVQTTGGTPSATQTQEMLRLQARLASGSKTVVVLVLLTTALMAIARYL